MATLKDLGMFGARALFGADNVDRGIQNRQAQDYNRNRNQLAELDLQFQQGQQGNRNRLAELTMQNKENQASGSEIDTELKNAKVFVGALGSDFEQLDPQAKNQRWQMARQRLISLDPSNEDMPETFDPQGYSMVKGMASLAGQAGNTGVQSTFTTEDGKLGLVFRDGRREITDTGVQRSYQARDYGDRPFIFDSKSGQLMPVGGAAGDAALSAADQQREAELQQKRQEAQDKEGAKATAGAAETERSNAAAYSTYETGMRGLADSLGATTTGPVAGLLPAFSDEARIAEGAIAAMAPILKQMFRSAGEGTFTDNDQKLLMDMIPTRQDRPAVQRAKFSNIDSIVRAKLGVGAEPAQQSPAPQQAPQQEQDPQSAAKPEVDSLLEKYR